MPRIDDHPLRLARMRAGMPQSKLAAAANVNRSTISAIEENRVTAPTSETMRSIESVLGLTPTSLEQELTRWQLSQHARGPILNPKARILLEQTPTMIAAMFPTWVSWRLVFSPSPTHFASLLGLNRQVVAGYERGIRVQGMPDPLTHALLTVLGVSPDYLKVLQQLPPSED